MVASGPYPSYHGYSPCRSLSVDRVLVQLVSVDEDVGSDKAIDGSPSLLDRSADEGDAPAGPQGNLSRSGRITLSLNSIPVSHNSGRVGDKVGLEIEEGRRLNSLNGEATTDKELDEIVEVLRLEVRSIVSRVILNEPFVVVRHFSFVS